MHSRSQSDWNQLAVAAPDQLNADCVRFLSIIMFGINVKHQAALLPSTLRIGRQRRSACASSLFLYLNIIIAYVKGWCCAVWQSCLKTGKASKYGFLSLRAFNWQVNSIIIIIYYYMRKWRPASILVLLSDVREEYCVLLEARQEYRALTVLTGCSFYPQHKGQKHGQEQELPWCLSLYTDIGMDHASPLNIHVKPFLAMLARQLPDGLKFCFEWNYLTTIGWFST